MAALAGMLAWYVLSSRIYLYIHERSVLLVALCVPLLGAMVVAGLRRGPAGSVGRVGFALLALPVAVGLLLPSHPLTSAALEMQLPAESNSQSWVSGEPLQLASGAMVLDLRQMSDVQALDPEMRGLEGQRASLLGFVYRTPGLPADQFLVGRFVVRCCTADAVAISFPVRYDRSSELAHDTWVEVDGTVKYLGQPGAVRPVVEAEQVRVVPQPARPYLYQ